VIPSEIKNVDKRSRIFQKGLRKILENVPKNLKGTFVMGFFKKIGKNKEKYQKNQRHSHVILTYD
jgi:hypothetical protein